MSDVKSNPFGRPSQCSSSKAARGSSPFTKKCKPIAREAQAAGAWLAERAPHVFLTEFGNRPCAEASEASDRFYALVESLKQALGPVANDQNVAAILHQIDGVVWEIAVEHEDRAWHAAWSLAMGLRSGISSPSIPVGAKR